MRGSKAKAIRRAVRNIVGDEVAQAPTQYDVITHPPKQRMNPLTGEVQAYNPRQLVVVSQFRKMVQDTKKAFAAIRGGELTQADLQFA